SDEPAAGSFPAPPSSGLGNLISQTATGAAEARAVDTLNTRPPGADQARDDAWDGRDGDHRDDSSTLGSGADNNSNNHDGLGRTSTDHQSIEDVRSLLHRTSTRGKRKAGESLSASSSRPPMNTIQSGLSVAGINERTPGGYQVTPNESGRSEYADYANRLGTTSSTGGLGPQYAQGGGAMGRPAMQGNAFARPPQGQGQGMGPYRL
ncbi:hypothetical protein LTS18_011824, partial [Coniosporium uncinatum]